MWTLSACASLQDVCSFLPSSLQRGLEVCVCSGHLLPLNGSPQSLLRPVSRMIFLKQVSPHLFTAETLLGAPPASQDMHNVATGPGMVGP